MAEPVGEFWSTPPQACNVYVCALNQVTQWINSLHVWIYATLLLQDKLLQSIWLCSFAFYPYTTRKLDLIVHVTHTLIVKF